MADTSMSIRDREACFGPDPELYDPDLQCKPPDESDVKDGGTPQTVAAGPSDRPIAYSDALPDYDPETIRAMAKERPDYATVSVSANFPLLATVGIAASYTVDRYGHSYFGLSMGAGAGVALPVSLGATHGMLVHDQPGAPTTEEQLRNFLCGDSVAAKGGVIAGVGVANSAGGTAIETGVATAAEVSVSFGHNWGSGCP